MISFDVEVNDKSAICWSAATGQCTPVNHIRFLSTDAKVSADFSQEVEVLAMETPGHYRFSVN